MELDVVKNTLLPFRLALSERSWVPTYFPQKLQICFYGECFSTRANFSIKSFFGGLFPYNHYLKLSFFLASST